MDSVGLKRTAEGSQRKGASGGQGGTTLTMIIISIVSGRVGYSKSSAFGSGVAEQAIARYEMKTGMRITEGGVQAKAWKESV